MNTLVVYESQFGNTERIARAIAHALAQRGSVRLEPIEKAAPAVLEGVDLLVLGSPTQFHEATPDTLAWLDRVASGIPNDLPVAVFDTRYHVSRLFSGSAAHVISKEIQERGAKLIAPPESFFVVDRQGPLEAGECERAAAWAGTLADVLAAQTLGTHYSNEQKY